MADFIPNTQEGYAEALLSFVVSDPDIQEDLLPSDLEVGSLERAHVEAIASLMEENDQRLGRAILKAISESTFNALGFDLLPARAALGTIVCTTYVPRAADIVIPSGYQVVGRNGIIYATTEDGAILAGDLTCDPIPAVALTGGPDGNAAAGTVTIPVASLEGVDGVTNPAAFVGGSAEETADARAARFAAYLKTLPRGTTDALEFATAMASSSVVAVRAVEPFLLTPVPDGVPFAGLVWIYVDDGTTNADLQPALKLAILKAVNGYTDQSGTRVPGYKAAGAIVELKKVTRVPVYVRGDVSVTPEGIARWEDVQAALTAAAEQYFSQLRVGDPVSYQNLVSLLTGADADIMEVRLYLWKSGMAMPPYGGAISGDPITFSGISPGARGALAEVVAPGPSGNVTYPEWRLV